MSSDLIVTSQPDPRLRVVTICRPYAGNALDEDAMLALALAFEKMNDESNINAVAITGQGNKFFCSGGDINKYASIRTPDELRRIMSLGRRTLVAISNISIPVISAINGYALGGGLELALATDVRIAASSAIIGMPQTLLGILPGWDGVERLVTTVGISRAAHILFSGKKFDASEAQNIGLVSEVCAPWRNENELVERLEPYLQGAPLAMRATKTLLNNYSDPEVENRCGLAAEALERLWFTNDHKEAEAAFAEKRMPKFKGR